MRSGPDTENLFHQLNIETFPYREFSDARQPIPGATGASARWSASLEILQREWIQAVQTQALVSANFAQPAEETPAADAESRAPRATVAKPPMSGAAADDSRPRLKRLFRRDTSDEVPSCDTSLSDLFDRIR